MKRTILWRIATLSIVAMILFGNGVEKKKSTSPPPSLSPTTRVLTMQVVGTADSLAMRQANAFVDRVARMSSGKIMIKVQSGPAEYQMLQNGEADFLLLDNIRLSQADRTFAMFSLPFLYDSYHHMSIALNSEQMNSALSARLRPHGIVPLLALCEESYQLVTSGQEVILPQDFKTLSVALHTDNADKLSLFDQLGTLVLPYSQTHLGPLLDTNVEVLPDDPLNNPDIYTTVNAIEVTYSQAAEITQNPLNLNVINTYHTLSPLWLTISTKIYDQLNATEKAILLESCASLAAEYDAIFLRQENARRAELRTSGMTMIDPEYALISKAIYGADGRGNKDSPLPAYFDPILYQMIRAHTT